MIESFQSMLNRLDQEHPELNKVTKKDLWEKWLSGERMPTHNQMMKIIKIMCSSPYQIQIWKRVFLTSILGNRPKFTYDDIHVVDIHPLSCPRPRFTKYGSPYMPPKYVLWKKELIRQLDNRMKKYEKPISLDVEFWFFSENKIWGYHTQKPDIDNLQKALLDGMQDGKFIKDDCYVHTIQATKFWAYEPKIIIKIKRDGE